MFIAKDFPEFKKLFVSRLKDMLSDDELGAFILVLANSQQDNDLKNILRDDLQQTFIALKDRYTAGSLQAPQDDLDVFEQLLDMELGAIEPWRYRPVGDWELAFNSIRKLRPARAASQQFSSIQQPYDANRFHFNKPFLAPEILWEGDHRGKCLRVLYNKFPFADYHLLVAVSPEQNQSQLLTKESHYYAVDLASDAAEVLPGFGMGFNSLAAGASVNHLHFQGFIREHEFAIEKQLWAHNDGDADYPLEVKRFRDAESSWSYLEHLIAQDIAFNCLYRYGSCYVIPRKYQGNVQLPDWLSGAGWLDLAGVVTVSDEQTYAAVTGHLLNEALALLSC
jgi:hypothetical protein